VGIHSLIAMNRALFVDRDGVIVRAIVRNGKPSPPSSVTEMEILPDVGNALWRAKQLGYINVVVTNQPDVARGTLPQQSVEDMHRKLITELPIDDILVCYHDDADQCECRKPRPGLLHAAAVKHNLDLSSCVMVGDRWRDIDAGAACGCRTILVDYKYRERTSDAEPDLRVQSLAEAVAAMAEQRSID
jgi:D-glycero-D-manno-heptose 1,7-bisphosphate phosphatase